MPDHRFRAWKRMPICRTTMLSDECYVLVGMPTVEMPQMVYGSAVNLRQKPTVSLFEGFLGTSVRVEFSPAKIPRSLENHLFVALVTQQG